MNHVKPLSSCDHRAPGLSSSAPWDDLMAEIMHLGWREAKIATQRSSIINLCKSYLLCKRAVTQMGFSLIHDGTSYCRALVLLNNRLGGTDIPSSTEHGSFLKLKTIQHFTNTNLVIFSHNKCIFQKHQPHLCDDLGRALLRATRDRGSSTSCRQIL